MEFECILICPAGIQVAEPIGLTGMKRSKEQDSGPLFYYKKKIEGTLTFIRSDYNLLRTWERSDKRCEKATLIVKQKINGVFTELFREIMGPDDISWNPEKCECAFNVSTDDPDWKFVQYDAIKDKQFNIFDLASHNITWEMKTPAGSDYTVTNGILLLTAA